MIGLRLEQAKAGFFDRQRVRNATDQATRKVLSKFGAFVRTRAKSSIRKRKKPSQPGQPPSSHVGLLKKFIFFSFDRQTKSVVIGPTRLSNRDGKTPSRLEKGGTRLIKGESVTYAARPFMGPAFQQEQQQLPDLWRNAVRK